MVYLVVRPNETSTEPPLCAVDCKMQLTVSYILAFGIGIVLFHHVYYSRLRYGAIIASFIRIDAFLRIRIHFVTFLVVQNRCHSLRIDIDGRPQYLQKGIR